MGNNQGVKSNWQQQDKQRFQSFMAKQRAQEDQQKIVLMRKHQKRREKKLHEKMRGRHQHNPKAMGHTQPVAPVPVQDNEAFIVGNMKHTNTPLKEAHHDRATAKQASKQGERILLNKFRQRIQEQTPRGQTVAGVGMQIFKAQYMSLPEFTRKCKQLLKLDINVEQVSQLFDDFVSNIDGQLNVKKLLVTAFPENELEAWLQRSKQQEVEKVENYEMELDELQSIRNPGKYVKHKEEQGGGRGAPVKIMATLQMMMEGRQGGSRSRRVFLQQVFDPENTGFASAPQMKLGLGKLGFAMSLHKCVALIDSLPSEGGCVNLKRWSEKLEADYERSLVSTAQYIGLGFDKMDPTTGVMTREGKGKNNTVTESLHCVAALGGIDDRLPVEVPKKMVPDGMRSKRAQTPWAVDRDEAAQAAAIASGKSKKVAFRSAYHGSEPRVQTEDEKKSEMPRPADLIRLQRVVRMMAEKLDAKYGATHLIVPALMQRHGKQQTVRSFTVLMRDYYNVLIHPDDGRAIWKLCKGANHGRSTSAAPRAGMGEDTEGDRVLDFQKFVDMVIRHIYRQGDGGNSSNGGNRSGGTKKANYGAGAVDPALFLPKDLPSDNKMCSMTDRQLDLMVNVQRTPQRPASAAAAFSPVRPSGVASSTPSVRGRRKSLQYAKMLQAN
jgi:hypothetical protein